MIDHPHQQNKNEGASRALVGAALTDLRQQIAAIPDDARMQRVGGIVKAVADSHGCHSADLIRWNEMYPAGRA